MQSAIKNYLFVDTHVHIYPNYKLDIFFNKALANFEAISNKLNIDDSSIHKLLCLTERFDSNYFESFRNDTKILSKIGLKLDIQSDDRCIKLTNQNGQSLFLLKGYQIVTLEGLEILSLITHSRLCDRLPIRQVISEIKEINGVAVLPWSPGKWYGKRGQIVRALLEEINPSDLHIGDISIRPKSIPDNSILNIAKDKKFKILVGSDPLPTDGEERQVARYILSCRSESDVAEGQLITILNDQFKRGEFIIIGNRNNLLEGARRWLRARF